MDIVSIGQNRYSISLPFVEIEVEDYILTDPVFIVRLLTYSEILNYLKYDKDINPVSNLVVEEEIFLLCIDEIAGIDNLSSVDLTSIDAGIVSTVAGVIIEESISYVNDFEARLDSESQEVILFDQIELVVSKNFNIDYESIKKMSVNELFKKYATFCKTYPNEALVMKEDGDE